MTERYSTAANPTLHPTAWVAPSADVRGDVTLGAHASIWYQCVLRGDIAPIRIGAESNVQDLTMVHVDIDRPCMIGSRVGIGHRAIVHGCEIEDDCLIGMGGVVREVDEELRRRARQTVEHYRELKEGHRTGRWLGPPPRGEHQ